MKHCSKCIHYWVCDKHCDAVRYNGGGCDSCELGVCGAGVCDHYEEAVHKIVHCKNCKHYCHKVDHGMVCRHPKMDYDVECCDQWVEVSPDDFCSYGERKEDAE